MNPEWQFIEISCELERTGLVWHPEIGDEVSARDKLGRVAILVDPAGMSLAELRESFIWLPTIEQLVRQFEAREALIYHVGINNEFAYEAVVKTAFGAVIETQAASLRLAFGQALKGLMTESHVSVLH